MIYIAVMTCCYGTARESHENCRCCSGLRTEEMNEWDVSYHYFNKHGSSSQSVYS